MQAPGLLDLNMYKGASWDYTLTWQTGGTAVNLTGYDARMQVRETHASGTAVLSLTVGSGITLGGTAGTIVLEATAVVVATSATSATVEAVGAASATVFTERATITSALQQVDTIGDPSWIQMNTSAVVTGAPGRLAWNDTDGTLDIYMKGGPVTQQVGMEQYVRVKSSTNAGLLEGKVVAFNSSDGINKLVTYPTAANGDSFETLGIMTETVTGGNSGLCTTFGLVRGLNTNNLVEGEPVWLSPTEPGGMTAVKPSAPNRKVLIGFCIRKQQSNGSIFVNVSAGSELGGTDSNVQITNPQHGDVLRYNSVTKIWENGQP